MKFSDFLSKIPYLCGAKNAQNCAEVLRVVFQAELDGKANFVGDVNERVGFIFDLMAGCEYPEVLAQCRSLVLITAYAHKELEHKTVLSTEENTDYEDLVQLVKSSGVDVGYTLEAALAGIWG